APLAARADALRGHALRPEPAAFPDDPARRPERRGPAALDRPRVRHPPGAHRPPEPAPQGASPGPARLAAGRRLLVRGRTGRAGRADRAGLGRSGRSARGRLGRSVDRVPPSTRLTLSAAADPLASTAAPGAGRRRPGRAAPPP